MLLDRIDQYITREVALRLTASIALALILWAFVTLRQNPETSRAFNEVPVHAQSLDASLIIVNELEPVRVELSGPRSDVTPIETSSLFAHIDFSDIDKPGEYKMPVAITEPEGVWRSKISPTVVSVIVEPLASKPFRLSPVVTDLDQNSLRTVTVYPDVEQITATGPSSSIDSISEIVLPVEISGGTRTLQDIYVPEARDRDGNVISGVTLEPSAVTATVRVSARGKSVAVLANIVGSPAAGYEVADRTVNPQFVIVDGSEQALDSLIALSTEPIDISGANASFNQSVAITGLPDGVQILQPSDGRVDVLVQITQRGVHQSLPSQQVTVVGVAPGLAASVNPDDITIDIVAPDDVLVDLDAETLQVLVDASGLEAGTYTVKPSVIMPPRVQWVATFPSEVTLTLVPAIDLTTSGTSATPNGVPSGTPSTPDATE